MSASSDRTVRPTEAVSLIKRCMEVGRPVMLWAGPGIGKSDIIQQIGDEQGRPVIDMRLLLCEPTDLKGIPFFNSDKNTMSWARPNELPAITSEEDVAEALLLYTNAQKHSTELSNKYKKIVAENEKLGEHARAEGHELADKDRLEFAESLRDQCEKAYAAVKKAEENHAAVKHMRYMNTAILFLDEINSAPPSVQAAAYQLMLNKRIGEYFLPPGVSIVCAGNRDTDRGVTYRMPSPLANRIVHLEMAVNFDDWQKWALMNGVHTDVVGFLSHHKQHICSFDPKSPSKAFATPRSWVFVSQLLSDGLPESMNTTLVAGTVGEGIAIEFAQHRKVSAKMPRAEDILTGKNPDLVVKEISAHYSLTISMCYTLREWAEKAKDANEKYSMDDWHESVDFFFEYMMKNFQPELVILGAKSALRDFDLPIKHHQLKTFGEFQKKFGKYILAE